MGRTAITSHMKGQKHTERANFLQSQLSSLRHVTPPDPLASNVLRPSMGVTAEKPASEQWKNEIGVLEMFLSFYDCNARGGTLRDCLYDVLAFYEEHVLRQGEEARRSMDFVQESNPVSAPMSWEEKVQTGMEATSLPNVSDTSIVQPDLSLVKAEAEEVMGQDVPETERWQQPLSLPCDAVSLSTYFPPPGIDLPQTSAGEGTEVETGVSSVSLLQKQRRRVECPICHKNFSSQTVLRQHERVHTDERPYSCPLCSKSYKHKHRLKDHMLQHSGSKPYKCHVCHKPFRRSDSLKTHLQVHVNHRQRIQRQMAAFSLQPQPAVLGQLSPMQASMQRPADGGREMEETIRRQDNT